MKSRVWKSSTRGTTDQIIETYILKELGNRALSLITRKELQAHLDAKAESNLSESPVGHIRWHLVAIFKMAMGDGIITINPTDGLVTPKCKASGEKRTISAENMRRAQLALDIGERLIFRLADCEGIRECRRDKSVGRWRFRA